MSSFQYMDALENGRRVGDLFCKVGAQKGIEGLELVSMFHHVGLILS